MFVCPKMTIGLDSAVVEVVFEVVIKVENLEAKALATCESMPISVCAETWYTLLSVMAVMIMPTPQLHSSTDIAYTYRQVEVQSQLQLRVSKKFLINRPDTINQSSRSRSHTALYIPLPRSLPAVN